MAGTKVGDLFMALSLDPNLKSWDVGKAAIEQTVAKVKQLALASATAKVDAQKLAEQMGLVARASHWDKLKSSGNGVASTFWRMAAAAAAFFSVSKVSEMVKETVDLGGHLNDTSQKTGLSTDALQKWGYAAKLNGSDSEAFTGGVVKLSKGLADVATGKGPAVDAFNALGISLNDPAVKSKDLNAILNLVANKFSAMPDGAKKTAISMDLFGRAGAGLIPTLNQGVAGIAATGSELARLGGVMDSAAIAHLDDLGDNIDRVKTAFTGLKNQAVIALLPLLEQLMKQFQDWVANNQELIKSTLRNAVEALITAVSTLASAVAFAVKHWRLLAAILAGAALISGIMKLIKTIMWLETVMASAAIEAVIAWALILGPILLVGIALVGIGLGIYALRDQIWAALQAIGRFFADVGGAIGGFFSGAWDVVASTAATLWDGLKSGFSAAWEWIANLKPIKMLIGLVDSVRGLLSSSAPDGRSEEAVQQQGASSGGGSEADAMFGPSGYFQPTSGATGPTASLSPTKPSRAAAGSTLASVSNSYTIQIDAKNADASQVAALVDDKLREHDERTRRDMQTGLGVLS